FVATGCVALASPIRRRSRPPSPKLARDWDPECGWTETHRYRRFQLSQPEVLRSTLQTVVKLPHDSRAARELSLQERSKQALYQRPVPAAKIAIGAPCA